MIIIIKIIIIIIAIDKYFSCPSITCEISLINFFFFFLPKGVEKNDGFYFDIFMRRSNL